MRSFALLLSLLLALPATAADYAREQKWADEVLPSVLVGDPVHLQLAGGHRFLALYTEATSPKAAVILLHGLGVHPDWGLISPLRQSLPDAGFTTLSVQMPVLGAEAKSPDYAVTLDEAAERVARAVIFLQDKGYTKIALVSHSLGCRMADRYLTLYPQGAVKSWVAIGYSGTADYGRLKFPILDLYGENDLPAVFESASLRAIGLKGKSAQEMVPKADHFFEGQDAVLLGKVRAFLDQTL